MKKSTLLLGVLSLAFLLFSACPMNAQIPSSRTRVVLFAFTNHIVEIDAENYASKSSIDMSTGDIVFTVPMAEFAFKNELMEKHYNSDEFMDTEQFPIAELKARVKNVGKINFYGDGVYEATVIGELTIKGVTHPITEKGTITVKDGLITTECDMTITLADYNITFTNNKLAQDLKKTVDVSVFAEYISE